MFQISALARECYLISISPTTFLIIRVFKSEGIYHMAFDDWQGVGASGEVSQYQPPRGSVCPRYEIGSQPPVSDCPAIALVSHSRSQEDAAAWGPRAWPAAAQGANALGSVRFQGLPRRGTTAEICSLPAVGVRSLSGSAVCRGSAVASPGVRGAVLRGGAAVCPMPFSLFKRRPSRPHSIWC